MYYKFQRLLDDENNKTLAMARQMKVLCLAWRMIRACNFCARFFGVPFHFREKFRFCPMNLSDQGNTEG